MERKPRGRNCAAESEGLTLLLCRGMNRRGAPTLQQERDPSSEHPVVRELWVGRSSGAPLSWGLKGDGSGQQARRHKPPGRFCGGEKRGGFLQTAVCFGRVHSSRCLGPWTVRDGWTLLRTPSRREPRELALGPSRPPGPATH